MALADAEGPQVFHGPPPLHPLLAFLEGVEGVNDGLPGQQHVTSHHSCQGDCQAMTSVLLTWGGHPPPHPYSCPHHHHDCILLRHLTSSGCWLHLAILALCCTSLQSLPKAGLPGTCSVKCHHTMIVCAWQQTVSAFHQFSWPFLCASLLLNPCPFARLLPGPRVSVGIASMPSSGSPRPRPHFQLLRCDAWNPCSSRMVCPYTSEHLQKTGFCQGHMFPSGWPLHHPVGVQDQDHSSSC